MNGRPASVTPFFLNGTLFGPAYTLPPPTLVFLSAIVYPKDLEIIGYEFGFQGISTFTGPYIPTLNLGFPITALVVIGTQNPVFSIQNPIVGQALTSILAAIDGGNAYIPANGAAVPPRPETVSQTATTSAMFPQGNVIPLSANTPISMYCSLSNNSTFDAVNAAAIIYVREPQR